MKLLKILVLILNLFFFCSSISESADWHISGTAETISSNTDIAGTIYIENGGSLTISNATLTLLLDFDEQYWIEISGNSSLIVDNGIIVSSGGQYWIDLFSVNNDNPLLQVSGSNSLITGHSGIRPSGHSQVQITGGDVEELQVHDSVSVSVQNAASYLVLFFDNQTSILNDLHVGSSVTNNVNITGGWSLSLTNADIYGYQIDLENNANVTMNNSDGIVLSIHTPGNLSGLRVVENLTANISGGTNNLGSVFSFNNCEIDMINVYTAGNDKVLLRNMNVNEVNAEAYSELTVGQSGYTTVLNCNLCQSYDEALLAINNVIIDNSDTPSATCSYHNDPFTIGKGKMQFTNSDLRSLYITAMEEGKITLSNCQYDPDKLTIIDSTASITVVSVPTLTKKGFLSLVIIFTLLIGTPITYLKSIFQLGKV